MMSDVFNEIIVYILESAVDSTIIEPRPVMTKTFTPRSIHTSIEIAKVLVFDLAVLYISTELYAWY